MSKQVLRPKHTEHVTSISSNPAFRFALGLLALLGLTILTATAQEKPRLIILTDIGGDPDDQQSMRRLMLYANEFRIEGLIASASGTPGEVGRAITRPDLIEEIVADYEAVRPNLQRHADGYPSAEDLRRVIRSGNPHRGVENVGEGNATPGSEHIISVVDADESGPVHIAIWGGATDLAQALYDVRRTRSPGEVRRFLSRLRVYAIADQDETREAPGTGAWIREHVPDLRYVETGPPGMDRFTALFRGMYQNDAAGGGEKLPLVAPEVVPLNQTPWVEANVRTGHGPLGARYPRVRQNPGSENNTEGVKEGDTPSWFYVLPNGLSDPEHPGYGGWGGRFEHDTGGHYIDAQDEHPSGLETPGLRRKWTVARWREAYQNDFAARMDWSVKPPGEANHNPVAVVSGDRTRNILALDADPGSVVRLDASGSEDPDGDALSYRWYVYREPSTYKGDVHLEGAGSPTVGIHVPENATGKNIHVILEVTDDGAPTLTAYRRVIIHVK